QIATVRRQEHRLERLDDAAALLRGQVFRKGLEMLRAHLLAPRDRPVPAEEDYVRAHGRLLFHVRHPSRWLHRYRPRRVEFKDDGPSACEYANHLVRCEEGWSRSAGPPQARRHPLGGSAQVLLRR